MGKETFQKKLFFNLKQEQVGRQSVASSDPWKTRKTLPFCIERLGVSFLVINVTIALLTSCEDARADDEGKEVKRYGHMFLLDFQS